MNAARSDVASANRRHDPNARPAQAPSTTARRAPAWRWPLCWFGLFTAVGMLYAEHFYLNEVANGRAGALLPRLAEELTAAWSVGALLPLAVVAVRRIRALSGWLTRLLGHLALLLAFSALHTSLIWCSRLLAFPALGLGPYSYGVMPWRYLMEFPSDVIVYGLIAAGTWLFDHFRANRARELRAAQLESALAATSLEALRLQLNPHFLFNALNAISAIMYEQPRAADEMLARIGALLRATLSARVQEHALAEELRLLELYLDIQRVRFGARLQIELRVAAGLDHIQVPFLVLQPLVENAIEHATAAARRHVGIDVGQHAHTIELTVRDRGAGAGEHRGHGIGLRNLRARLQHLYGNAGGLDFQRADGGTCVRLWLPLRRDSTT